MADLHGSSYEAEPLATRLPKQGRWRRVRLMNLSMRLFIALFFTLALPINGMAQLLMQTGSPAPVSESQHAPHHAHAHAMADHPGHDAMADCEQHDGNSLVCKSGQECKTSGLVQLHLAESVSPSPEQPSLISTTRFVPLPVPEPLWHPPRT